MTNKVRLSGLVLAWALVCSSAASARSPVDLSSYSDKSGAITILNGGDTADPYFAMQALLLAHDNGLDISAAALKFVNWLVPYQKPDGTFDRFCNTAAQTWMSCKTADADDSLLALWLRLLNTMPESTNQSTALSNSRAVSTKALEHLFQPSRGVYMVSPVYLHGLFMDNLEVWSLKASATSGGAEERNKLAQSIFNTFWQPVSKQFLVSTQLEQRSQSPQFYPDRVAQIFPLLMNFQVLPTNTRVYYKNWMTAHRAEWLRQGHKDYPWGLLAVLALNQGDSASAACWLRETAGMRHSSRWAVTDEISRQILDSRQLAAASKTALCR